MASCARSTGSIDYKYVLMNAAGHIIAWSKDPNRQLDIGSLPGSTVSVSEEWDAVRYTGL